MKEQESSTWKLLSHRGHRRFLLGFGSISCEKETEKLRNCLPNFGWRRERRNEDSEGTRISSTAGRIGTESMRLLLPSLVVIELSRKQIVKSRFIAVASSARLRRKTKNPREVWSGEISCSHRLQPFVAPFISCRVAFTAFFASNWPVTTFSGLQKVNGVEQMFSVKFSSKQIFCCTENSSDDVPQPFNDVFSRVSLTFAPRRSSSKFD